MMATTIVRADNVTGRERTRLGRLADDLPPGDLRDALVWLYNALADGKDVVVAEVQS